MGFSFQPYLSALVVLQIGSLGFLAISLHQQQQLRQQLLDLSGEFHTHQSSVRLQVAGGSGEPSPSPSGTSRVGDPSKSPQIGHLSQPDLEARGYSNATLI